MPAELEALEFIARGRMGRQCAARESLLTCSILTTAASGAITAVHERMPVVLAPLSGKT
ncbi:MAG: SOS response-associated peptidase family protein [Betaproteobacteria bacterium]|nr:SOS response-associated peptidase family protein [Betaproteobacteria bacterium]